MKTKEEILKMSREEMIEYKWSNEFEISYSSCSDCSDCSDCSHCSHCLHCSHCSSCSSCLDCSHCSSCLGCSSCYMCRNLTNKKDGYYICNVAVTKEEFEAKIKKENDEN